LRISFKVLAFQGQATVHAAIDTGDPRSDPRSNVFLLATIGAGPTSNPVKVRNLSVHGALLEGADLPTGTTAFLRRGSLRVAGVIAWRDRTHCGIRFQSSAIAHIRGGAAGPGAPLFSSRSKQELLASASAELLQISERIAAMPGMSIELAEELMKLDALAHSLKVAS
jgi:hypothetical protein